MARIRPGSQANWAARRMALAWLLLVGSLLAAAPTNAAQSDIACAPPPSRATPAATPATIDVPQTPFPDDGGKLTIFAAASLTDAFTSIAADLEADVPGLEITLNFAGSQALATQLAESAQADVFASANQVQMQIAIEAGRIADEPVPFVQNRLAVVVPSDDPASIQSPVDLAEDDIKLVLAQPEVPAGRYARQAICAMDADAATYGADFATKVAANIVSEEEDVRGVLTRIQLGEADAGIVYVSDAIAAGDAVTTIEIPSNVNVLASYPIAAVAGGNELVAAAFISYLLGAEGQATLTEYGFEPVEHAG